jgi:acetyl esterase/lipase
MKTVSQDKNIPYIPEVAGNYGKGKNLLDVYAADKENSDVLLFIHGGGWSAGSKNFYQKLGEVFAKKGITVVIINYRLAPDYNFMDMASDCAAAVKWVVEHIENYHGNKNRIFISGHSAGGHLAALISLNPEFFNKSGIANPIKGLILIDAFGLNAKEFIEAHQNIYLHHIKNIFTDDPKNWERGSPSEYVDNVKFPIYIFTGSETHDVLMYDNKIFVEKLEKLGLKPRHFILKGKTHMQMIMQMDKPDSEIYRELSSLLG